MSTAGIYPEPMRRRKLPTLGHGWSRCYTLKGPSPSPSPPDPSRTPSRPSRPGGPGLRGPPSPLRVRRRAWRPAPWGRPKGRRGRTGCPSGSSPEGLSAVSALSVLDATAERGMESRRGWGPMAASPSELSPLPLRSLVHLDDLCRQGEGQGRGFEVADTRGHGAYRGRVHPRLPDSTWLRRGPLRWVEAGIVVFPDEKTEG
jgi:hypothetical protein